MRNRFVVMLLTSAVALSASFAQAATRSNGPIEMAKVEDPASEMKCLEAFVNSEFDFAHSLCLSLAQQGMPDAQLVTGLMYALGEGTEQNSNLAKLWLKEAVRNGSLEAKEALVDLKLAD
ncbi:SEL1-like repeat protein [Paremcibacter congregatus]|uniref:Sel1 repeat family protein n=1 Tax=Paremcibacter congregatus TaxID=2043170 RepID=A0A2G4YPQ5_9PROT|nr:SEL1-like repeat protein [Paremcibacter congregatus]PHZ83436.1 hypothetical protein CRD36_17925 [Paremcibacter congregatus]QDE28096.1 SEL1-like repeat protein [Paremcibacter congregatus]|tara:strand:- start:4111 stop:4470 length:360 start_codon:yes stop_codon:yes gene_type:complete